MITSITYSPEFELTQARAMLARIREWVTEFYGERCPEYEPLCLCCKAWEGVDALSHGVEEQ